MVIISVRRKEESMVFSSLIFLFVFLPIVVFLYYISKEKYRNIILLIASLLFYSYGEPKFVLVMIGSIILNYVIALEIDKAKDNNKIAVSKVLLVVDITLNIGILFIFKYLDFSISVVNRIFKSELGLYEIALPIGISFFTFQALSYVIDVFRGTVAVQRNILDLALFISFFPQLIAGPIVRYSAIEKQITERKCSPDKFAEGTRRFFLGFGKKVLLANNLSEIVGEVFSMDMTVANPLILWIGSICFSLQIYYDFSGYSDMAIGLGKIFGFEFEENFNYPYISKSVGEFWRRWHISLGRWFRDYVYIPLGGSRVAIPRQVFNLLIVWIITGVWHGANYNFIIWGLGYFVLLVLEKFIIKPDKKNNVLFTAFWRIITLLSVNFGWVIFNSSGLNSGIEFCKGMLGLNSVSASVDADCLRYLREYGVLILLGVVFATPLVKNINQELKTTKIGHAIELLSPILYGLIFLCGVSYIILGANNPFIYFNF